MYRFSYDRAMLIRTPVETLHSPLRYLKTALRPKGSMESRYHVPNTKMGERIDCAGGIDAKVVSQNLTYAFTCSTSQP